MEIFACELSKSVCFVSVCVWEKESVDKCMCESVHTYVYMYKIILLELCFGHNVFMKHSTTYLMSHMYIISHIPP